MFKRENRLAPEVSFNKARVYIIPQLVLKLKENGLDLNRFGIIVSKKVDKKAVTRNMIKRLLRTILINLNKKMKPGHDILLIVKKNVTIKVEKEKLSALEELFGKMDLIKK